MIKTTFIKGFTLLIAVFMVMGSQAQLREVKLYCSDDWTIDDGHKDGGVDWGNNLCNNDDDGTNGNGYQEAWVKWDLSSIELADGEEIISAEMLIRAAYNSEAQGFEAIVLADKYDNWNENDFSWNKALALGDFMTDGGESAQVVEVANQMNVYIPGENLVTEKFSVLEYVKGQIAGDKLITFRMKPYYDTFDGTDKKWLGFYPRQPHSTWDQTMAEAPNDDISAWAPYLKIKIAVPAEQFSTEDMQFGNINNYNITPTNSWFAIEDAAGEGRLLMLKNNSNNPDSIGAMAIYKNKNDYSDFDLTLDARVNDALSEQKTNVSIIFDYIDESNYACFTFYGVPLASGEKLNGVYNVVENVRTPVGELKEAMAIMDDEYHTYAVSREGSVVTAKIDGEIFYVVDDATLSGKSGSIGYGSAKFLVNFDNVEEINSTDLESVKLINTIQVYPNPVARNASIVSAKEIQNVKLYDITGRVIMSKENVYSMNLSIDVSDLPKGIYIVEVESNGSLSSSRLIKE